MELRDLIDSTLCEVRLDVGKQRREQIVVAEFFDEIAFVASLHAGDRDIHLLVACAPRAAR